MTGIRSGLPVAALKFGAMPTNLRLSEDANLFEVRYVGALTFAQRARAIEETQFRLKDCWVKKVLIDFTAAYPAEYAGSAADEKRFRAALERATFTRGARIAFLGAPSDHDAEMMEFSKKKGYKFRSFYERQHAMEWLYGTQP